jgi:hypothetical protein
MTMRCTLERARFEFQAIPCTTPTRTGGWGFCHLRIYQDDQPGSIPVVVASDRPDNPGPSVRDVVIHVAAAAWSELLPALADNAPVFITHYPRDHPERRHSGTALFTLVRFRVVQPAWRRVLQPTFERLDDVGLAARVGPAAAAELAGWQWSAASSTSS